MTWARYTVGLRFPCPVACSNACAICSTLQSPRCRPTICNPTGSPLALNPAGTEIAGFAMMDHAQTMKQRD